MINCKISCAIATKSFRCNSYRNLNLNLHRKFSKVSASKVHISYYNIKNQSTCFPLSSGLSRKSLLCVTASSNLESRRNFSNILRDIQKYFEPEKQDAAAESTENALQSEEISFNLLDILDGVSNSWLIKTLENHIIEIHEASGLPWWGTIAFTAFLFRTSVVFPVAAAMKFLMIKTRTIDINLQKLEPSLKEQIARDQKKFGWTDEIAEKKLAIAINKNRNSLIYNSKCHPLKGYILPIVQVPLWLSLTLATRNLCIPSSPDVSNPVYSELSTSGVAWITNLTVADPYMVLPISLALVNLAIIEIHQLFRVEARTKREQRAAMFYRCMSLGFIPVAAYMPSAINIYWFTSSLYGFTQSFILHSASFRRFLEQPAPEPEQKHPYRLLKKNVQLRLGMKSSSKGTKLESLENLMQEPPN